MVFNATFNNISVISWGLVLLMEESGEDHQPAASHWHYLKKTKKNVKVLYNILSWKTIAKNENYLLCFWPVELRKFYCVTWYSYCTVVACGLGLETVTRTSANVDILKQGWKFTGAQ